MSLIGISGRIASGKDTVGKIIQILCYLEKIDIKFSMAAFEHNKKHFEGNTYYGDWHIKKFAFKLKQIVALLTGCTVEQLEDQEFKNKMLGEEWSKNRRFSEVSEDMDSASYVRDVPTYRWMLQKVGTEAMRDIIHEDVWVNSLFADYKKPAEVAIEKTGGYSNSTTPMDFPNWIITDMRFPNELEAVEKRGGITIRINRSMGWVKEQEEKLLKEQFGKVEHPSETALDNAEFNYTIHNNGTIEELVKKIREILLHQGILKGK